MPDVEQFLPQLVARVDIVSAPDLREPGDARVHEKPPIVTGDPLPKLRQENVASWPGADEIHGSVKDVQQLRQLVELASPQVTSQRRNGRAVAVDEACP